MNQPITTVRYEVIPDVRLAPEPWNDDDSDANEYARQEQVYYESILGAASAEEAIALSASFGEYARASRIETRMEWSDWQGQYYCAYAGVTPLDHRAVWG